MEPSRIVANKLMWQAARAFNENLSFNKKVVQRALAIVIKQNNTDREKPVAEKSWTAWVEKTESKIRLQARHIQQAVLKTPSAAWLRTLWGEDDGEPEKVNEDEEENEGKSDDDDEGTLKKSKKLNEDEERNEDEDEEDDEG
jgi:hypothetical protein